MRKIIFRLITSTLLTLIIISSSHSYIMKNRDDTNSIDRIRSCEPVPILDPYKLKEGEDARMAIIDRDDLIKFSYFAGDEFVESLTKAVEKPPTTEEIVAISALTLASGGGAPFVASAYFGGKFVAKPLFDAVWKASRADYNFQLNDQGCLTRLGLAYVSLKTNILAIQRFCGVISPRPKAYPSPVTDVMIIAKAALKGSKPQCGAALAAGIAQLGAFLAIELGMSEMAKLVMKRARLCGHNWKSWNPESQDKDQIGIYQRKLSKCVKCRLGIASYTKECPHKEDSIVKDYATICNDNRDETYGGWRGKLPKELMTFRKYREYINGGVEREDYNDIGESFTLSTSIMLDSISRESTDMKYCIDPTKVHIEADGDIKDAYYAGGDYEFDTIPGGDRLGPFPIQKYYYRGTASPKFNCKKYLQPRGTVINNEWISWDKLDTNKQSQARQIYKDAYDCCIRRRSGSVCVEYTYESSEMSVGDSTDEFEKYEGGDYYYNKELGKPTDSNYRICDAEDTCSFGSVEQTNLLLPLEFDSEYVTTSDKNIDSGGGNTLLCAYITSLCPFNHNIGGGTVMCDYAEHSPEDLKNPDQTGCKTSEGADGFIDATSGICTKNGFAGKCKNYCQMLKHCVTVDRRADYSQLLINSPYLDNSCFDFKGASQFNGPSSRWDVDIKPAEITRLTSPIAQCFRETFRNIFLNQAGHTKCIAGYRNETGGLCPDNEYRWKKGEALGGVTNDDGQAVYFSFFEFLQKSLHSIIQSFLILYVMIFGLKVIMSEKIIPRGEIIMTCLKIGVVIFFATGTAWQDFFFDGLYYISTTFGNMIINLELSDLVMEGNKIIETDPQLASQHKRCYFNPDTYDKGMQYVAIWDTFDCKLSQYLGFGPGLTVGNLAILIFSGLFTGPLGVKFAALLLAFAAMFFSIIYLVLYLFILSSLLTIILILISPIIMVSLLFEATKGIFDQWLRQLLESATQIIIIFAFISTIIFLFDNFFVGSATFSEGSDEPNCDCSCQGISYKDDIDNKKEFIENNKKTCGIISGANTGLIEYVGAQVAEVTKTNCAENTNVPKDEDNRVQIDCENIYQDGVCNYDEGLEIKDPKVDSLLCILNSNVRSQTGNLAIFGLIAPAVDILLAPERAKTLIMTLLKIVLATYIIYLMTGRVANLSSTLWGTKGLPDSVMKPIDGLAKLAKGSKFASKMQTIGSRGISKKAGQAGRAAIKASQRSSD
ncbi:MAG: hypothetical protein ACI9IL_000322 [Rickettsiales bacterium]|jgi:hypothetical protein